MGWTVGEQGWRRDESGVRRKEKKERKKKKKKKEKKEKKGERKKMSGLGCFVFNSRLKPEMKKKIEIHKNFSEKFGS